VRFPRQKFTAKLPMLFDLLVSGFTDLYGRVYRGARILRRSAMAAP